MKEIIKKSFVQLYRSVPSPIRRIIPNKLKQKVPHQITEMFLLSTEKEKTLEEWESMGKPVPPPHIVKQQSITNFQKQYQCKILVETGTYMGDMVNAQINNFEKIYSIELQKNLCKAAVKRFKQYQHINILQGDSGVVLKKLVPQLDAPSVFWLDGHYSGGITAKGEKTCPIYEELKAIFTSKINHIVLIDDARLFDGTEDYPKIKDLSEFILSHKPSSKIEIEDDIIRVECR